MPLDTDKNRPIATTAHWGTYYAEVENGKLTGLRDYEKDSSPSIIGQGILEALDDKVRVRRPMVRKGFLENGKSSNRKLRGKEPIVAVSWKKPWTWPQVRSIELEMISVISQFLEVLMDGQALVDFIMRRARSTVF